MNGKIFLRPVALPVMLVSIILVIIPVAGPALTAAGVVFYALAVYRAYQREKNRALPPGTEDELAKLPYRRRRLANLALAAARDIDRRLSALPRDVAARMPLTPRDGGYLAAGVVYQLRREAELNALAAVKGGEGAAAEAQTAAASAEKLFAQLQELQGSLAQLELASAAVDRDALLAQAGRAAEEVKAITAALNAARAELGDGAAAALGPGKAKDG